MSKPHISTRKYIKWSDKPASENTDTLVLTSAANYFVDIRIYLPTSRSQPSLPSNNPLPLSRLEWAFAGTSHSTPAISSTLPGHESEIVKPAHTVWTHWVDSKTTDDVRDEGDMIPQDSGEALEYGSMVNPETGKEEAYEECWVDLEAALVDGEGVHRSWVLRTGDGDEGRGVRGVLVRIGVFVQAVLRRGKDISVGRWMWSSDEGWQPVVLISNIEVPSGVFASEEILSGQRMKSEDGLEWVCVESFSWP